MSECRAITNFIGNAVATIVVARWEGELDTDQLQLALSGQVPGVDNLPITIPAAVPAE
jgi:aerobic C4-dicarboxylate transport protein